MAEVVVRDSSYRGLTRHLVPVAVVQGVLLERWVLEVPRLEVALVESRGLLRLVDAFDVGHEGALAEHMSLDLGLGTPLGGLDGQRVATSIFRRVLDVPRGLDFVGTIRGRQRLRELDAVGFVAELAGLAVVLDDLPVDRVEVHLPRRPAEIVGGCLAPVEAQGAPELVLSGC
ncbi:MAG: hypothetical protein R3B07_07995 [Polyangiaceae bacterium]